MPSKFHKRKIKSKSQKTNESTFEKFSESVLNSFSYSFKALGLADISEEVEISFINPKERIKN